MRNEAVALPVVLAAASVLTAQPPQRPSFRTAVELVQVDVVVTDQDGNPVRGLTKDDFTLADRRKPQTIDVFEEVGAEPRRASTLFTAFPPTLRLDVADNQTPQANRLIVLLLDDWHVWKERTDTVKQI
jgi:VWFA-related protein